MCYRLQLFIHLWAHGLRKGDEHPVYTPHVVWHSFLPLIHFCDIHCCATKLLCLSVGYYFVLLTNVY